MSPPKRKISPRKKALTKRITAKRNRKPTPKVLATTHLTPAEVRRVLAFVKGWDGGTISGFVAMAVRSWFAPKSDLTTEGMSGAIKATYSAEQIAAIRAADTQPSILSQYVDRKPEPLRGKIIGTDEFGQPFTDAHVPNGANDGALAGLSDPLDPIAQANWDRRHREHAAARLASKFPAGTSESYMGPVHHNSKPCGRHDAIMTFYDSEWSAVTCAACHATRGVDPDDVTVVPVPPLTASEVYDAINAAPSVPQTVVTITNGNGVVLSAPYQNGVHTPEQT